MASTSAQLHQDGASFPSGSSSWKYDVFMSFRGTDTRDGFVEHLYSALYEKVIFTFKDNQWLERGESISPPLVKAIEESRFAVVVFSENYASSKWCLEELIKILECQKKRALTVLSVFYEVDPSDLRKQRGSVGEAFAQYERDSSEEKVQGWRNALTEVTDISGWNSKTQGPEAKLVRDIAINILNGLGYNCSSDLEDDVGLLPNGLDYLSNDLRLHDWHGYPSKYLPSNFQPDSIITVKLSLSCLKLWNGRMGTKAVEIIILRSYRTEEISLSPNMFPEIRNLRVLQLHGIQLLNKSSSHMLSKISEWGLLGPSALIILSAGFKLPALLGFRALRNLDLLESNFSEGFLPDDLGSLSWLEHLDLRGTNIINLPTSIRDLDELQYLDLRNCKKLKTLPYLPTNNIIAVNGCTSLETLTDPTIFPRQLDGSFTNCHTLIKNRPSRLLEFLRNILKTNKESHIVVPEREILKYFRYQNNKESHMGHYVEVQLRPDWYQRLRGFVVCAIFEETAPSIDDERYAECDVMWNDVVVYSTRIYIGSVQFQSDPLFLHYMALHDWVGEIRRRAEVNDLKKNEIVFYFRRSSPEIVDIVAPVKCAVHIVYENDEEWSDSHLSIQQSDYDEKEKSPGL